MSISSSPRRGEASVSTSNSSEKGKAAQHERTTYETALAYVEAGLSVLPIRRDQSKRPALHAWGWLQEQLPTADHVAEWFDVAHPPGIAIVCGAVSGGLELIDFDRRAAQIFPAWRDLVEAERPGLVARLCQVRTPRPGVHVRYRCVEVPIPGNTKLASDPDAPRNERCLIETRGEGGYALAPGTPADCHETGRSYVHAAGPALTDLPTITADEREVLLRCARAFDAEAKIDTPPNTPSSNGTHGLRPGDDYDRRGPDWAEVLEPHGWRMVRQDGAVRYWRRPGKDGCEWSATTGYCHGKDGVDLLRVFSANAEPFDEGKAYGRFRAYTLLNHAGDFAAAARELGKQGYGDVPRRAEGESASPPPANEVTLGPLALKLGTPRRTASGKLTVPVNAEQGGAVVYPFQITTADSSRKAPARTLAEMAGVEVKLADAALVQVLALAAIRVDSRTEPEGPTLRAVLAEQVPQTLRLTHRTDRGLWSEVHGREIGRAEFVCLTPTPLLDACALASDAPLIAAGVPDRIALVRAMQMELGVLWADLLATLPGATEANVGANTEAGRRFLQALKDLWCRPMTFELAKGTDGQGDVASRASLASRVRRLARPYLDCKQQVQLRERWRPIHEAFASWWRPCITTDGEVIIALAMRYELVTQIGAELPGAYDQTSLAATGSLFRCFATDGEVAKLRVPDRLSGGGRLAVLHPDIVADILADPVEADPPSDADSVSDADVPSLSEDFTP